MLFPQWCNCQDGTAPPTSTSAPVPGLGVNTGVPSGTTNTGCWDASGQRNKLPALAWEFDILAPALPLPPGAPARFNTHSVIQTPHPDSLTFTAALEPNPNNIAAVMNILFFDSAGVSISGAGFVSPPFHAGDPPMSHNSPIPTNAVYWDFELNQTQSSTAGTEAANGRLQLFCAGQSPTQPATPCCPPDPILDTRLRRIEDFEQIIIQLLGQDLRGHVDGTRHAGLMGSGTVTLVDSVDAIRVEVNNSLASWPHNPGSPNYYISLGFITSIAAGSPLKGWRLVYGSQTFPIVSYADQIGYTLPASVSIDLVELLPAP